MLRSTTIHLDSTRFSDLFFNFEHPEYDRVYQAASNGRGRKDIEPIIDQDEVNEALLKDAVSFAGILGFDGTEQANVAAELTADFLRRV